jgi:hypothetical protein
MSDSKRTLKERAVHGMREFFFIFLYLWLVFSLLVLYKSVILSQHNIEFLPHGLAFLNALALGKVILVAQELHVADHYKNEPLIYPTLLKSFVFSLLLALFKLVEEVAIDLFHGASFRESVAGIASGSWKQSLASTALLFAVLIPFFAFTELRSLLGEKRLSGAFLHGRHLLNRAAPES